MICFGPITSRRLGLSLGINNIIPSKTCSYSCVYCQLGVTVRNSIFRSEFYAPQIILEEVSKHLEKIKDADYPKFLTIVPNGEPTLDIHLCKTIELLKSFKIPVAVFTNASLMYMPEVRENLKDADLVSVKLDATDEKTWKAINRPHPLLHLEKIIKGIIKFAEEYKGILQTETMLVKGINDNKAALKSNATTIAQIQPDKAYIAIPTRPPAIAEISAPNETIINIAYQIYSDTGIDTELLLDCEGIQIGFTGDATHDILNISAAHPIREDIMFELLKNNNASFKIVQKLINERKIKQTQWGKNKYYIRENLKKSP